MEHAGSLNVVITVPLIGFAKAQRRARSVVRLYAFIRELTMKKFFLTL
jgi:hypothetical protein